MGEEAKILAGHSQGSIMTKIVLGEYIRDDTYARFEENLGNRILNKETREYEIINGIADAQVDTERGVVICTAKNNVETRVEAYLKQNPD